jgi:hypothetical protein
MTYMLGSTRHEMYQPNRSIHVTRQHLERAKRRLEHNFVAFGLLDYPKESVRVLRSLLRLPPLVKRYDYGSIKTSNRTALVKKFGTGGQGGVNVKIGVASDDETKNKIRKMDSQSLSHYNAASDANSLKERLYQELGLAIRKANLLDVELYEYAKTLFQNRLLTTNTSAAAASTTDDDWQESSASCVVQIQSCPEPNNSCKKKICLE